MSTKTEARTVNQILGKAETAKHTIEDILEASRRTKAENLQAQIEDVAEYGRKSGKHGITEAEAEVILQLHKSTVSHINETAKALSKRLTVKHKELAKILQWHIQRLPYQEREDVLQSLALHLLDKQPSNGKLTFAICHNYIVDWWKAYHVRQHQSLEAMQEGNSQELQRLTWLREDYARAVYTLEANKIPIDSSEVNEVMVSLSQSMADLVIDDRRKAERADVVKMAHIIAGIAHYETIEAIDNADFAKSVWNRLPKQIQEITMRKLNRVRLTRWEVNTLHEFAAKHSHLLLNVTNAD